VRRSENTRLEGEGEREGVGEGKGNCVLGAVESERQREIVCFFWGGG